MRPRNPPKKPLTARRVLSKCGEALFYVAVAPIVCCWLGLCLIHGFEPCGTGKMKRRQQKAEQKRAEKLWGKAKWEFKMPTPPRRRTVSVSSTTKLQPWQKTLDQSQSPFFMKLPLEIRRLIYAHTLGGASVHLSVPCAHLRATYCPFKTCRCLLSRGQGTIPLDFGLSLLTTCRKVYSEAIETLYSENAFACTTGSSCIGTRLSSTVDLLPVLLLPQRLSQIRDLFFDCDLEVFVPGPFEPCWYQTCKALSTLTGLQRLRIIMRSPGDLMQLRERGEKMTTDLLQITAPRVFVVTLPFEDFPVPQVPPESRLRFELLYPSFRMSWLEETHEDWSDDRATEGAW